jgi:hypothetical protein
MPVDEPHHEHAVGSHAGVGETMDKLVHLLNGKQTN